MDVVAGKVLRREGSGEAEVAAVVGEWRDLEEHQLAQQLALLLASFLVVVAPHLCLRARIKCEVVSVRLFTRFLS